MDAHKVQLAHEFGLFAEEKATEEYIKRGCVVLERRWRLGKTEIDIIVQEGDTIVIIEVKGRSGRDMSPLEAITPDKKRRMVKAADVYIRRLKGTYNYRFDIVTITGNKDQYTLEILEDAFLSADIF